VGTILVKNVFYPAIQVFAPGYIEQIHNTNERFCTLQKKVRKVH